MARRRPLARSSGLNGSRTCRVIRALTMAKLELTIDAVLRPPERDALSGCSDVSRVRAALDEHFARRRRLRTAILNATGTRWARVASVITQASEANAAALDVPERDRRLTDPLTALPHPRLREFAGRWRTRLRH